jgi:hypothetical protein
MASVPMAKSHLPATVIGTVEPHSRPPKRVRNAEVRAREYLTQRRSRPPYQSVLAGTRSDSWCLVERSGFGVRCGQAAIIFSFAIGVASRKGAVESQQLDEAGGNGHSERWIFQA